MGFPGVTSGKAPSCKTGDIREAGSIPGLGRYPAGGRGKPLQYSCLEIPKDRGAWQAICHRVAKSQTRLKQLSIYTCIYVYIFFPFFFFPLCMSHCYF